MTVLVGQIYNHLCQKTKCFFSVFMKADVIILQCLLRFLRIAPARGKLYVALLAQNMLKMSTLHYHGKETA